MQEERVEGIVLQAREYRERERLLILFSPLGLLHLVVKGVTRGHLMWTEPFSHGEYLILKGRSDLFTCKEGKLLNPHIALRDNWQSLQVAGALAEAVLTTQLPGKESAGLFFLYHSYHAKVPFGKDCPAFLASFYLKLIRLEGVFGKECLVGWSLEEQKLAEKLMETTRFSELFKIEVPISFLKKAQEKALGHCGPSGKF